VRDGKIILPNKERLSDSVMKVKADDFIKDSAVWNLMDKIYL
jgi:hypothetical protein